MEGQGGSGMKKKGEGERKEACGKVNKNFGIVRIFCFEVEDGIIKDEGWDSRHGRPPGSIRTPIFERSLVILGRI